MMACQNNSAGASLLALFDEVAFVEAFAFVSGAQLIGELVVAYTPNIYDGVGGKDILMKVR